MNFRKYLFVFLLYLFFGILGLAWCYAQGASLPSELPRGNTRADPELAPLAGNIDVAELYLASGSPEAKERALAMLTEAMGSPSRRQAAYASYRLANEHFKSSNFPRALEFLEPMMRTVDYNDPILSRCRVAAEWAKGVCLFRLGEKRAAVATLSSLIDSAPLGAKDFNVARLTSATMRSFLGPEAGAESFLLAGERRVSKLARDEGGDELLGEMIILLFEADQKERYRSLEEMLLRDYPQWGGTGSMYRELSRIAKERGDTAGALEMIRQAIDWSLRGITPGGWITGPEERLTTKTYLIWDWVRSGEIAKARELVDEIVEGRSPELAASRDPIFRKAYIAYVFGKTLETESESYERDEVAKYYRLALSMWPEHDNPSDRHHMEAFLAEVEGRSSKTE